MLRLAQSVVHELIAFAVILVNLLTQRDVHVIVAFEKAIKTDLIAAGSKFSFAHGDLGSGRQNLHSFHLSGNKALPDQSIELELFAGKMRAQALRSAERIGRPDGFMSILLALFILIHP